jgi:hypothetical protein
MSSSMSRLDVGIDASDSLGLARWLPKPLEPLAMQTQEPKMKAAPSSRVMMMLK